MIERYGVKLPWLTGQAVFFFFIRPRKLSLYELQSVATRACDHDSKPVSPRRLALLLVERQLAWETDSKLIQKTWKLLAATPARLFLATRLLSYLFSWRYLIEKRGLLFSIK